MNTEETFVNPKDTHEKIAKVLGSILAIMLVQI
jgi:hypothetical protein